jgi:SAM-dependent methyltransferase
MSSSLGDLSIQEQYCKPGPLQARIGVHARFSTNSYGWQRWVFDHLQLAGHARVLELGCGPAGLWCDNVDRIPASWDVLLSDRSVGMVLKTQHGLSGASQFRILRADADTVPLATASVDAVIANHMLYHVADLDGTLAGIRRVLRPGGAVFASTVGNGHLKELEESLVRFDRGLSHWGGGPYETFHLDSGRAILERWFDSVEVDEYDDALEVTEVQPLVEYVLSSMENPDELRPALSEWFSAELARGGGTMHISKRSGIFYARRR